LANEKFHTAFFIIIIPSNVNFRDGRNAPKLDKSRARHGSVELRDRSGIPELKIRKKACK